MEEDKFRVRVRLDRVDEAHGPRLSELAESRVNLEGQARLGGDAAGREEETWDWKASTSAGSAPSPLRIAEAASLASAFWNSRPRS